MQVIIFNSSFRAGDAACVENMKVEAIRGMNADLFVHDGSSVFSWVHKSWPGENFYNLKSLVFGCEGLGTKLACTHSSDELGVVGRRLDF